MRTNKLSTNILHFEITALKEDSNHIIIIKNIFTGKEIKIISPVNITSTTGRLSSWIKTVNYRFPTIVEYDLIEELLYNGLNQWIIKNKLQFNYNYGTYITNETISGIIKNPYGNDFHIVKYVAYNFYDKKIVVLDNMLYVHYMLIS